MSPKTHAILLRMAKAQYDRSDLSQLLDDIAADWAKEARYARLEDESLSHFERSAWSSAYRAKEALAEMRNNLQIPDVAAHKRTKAAIKALQREYRRLFE
jgi:hypothetical protein